MTVADIYDHPTSAALAAHLDDMATPSSALNADVMPVPVKTQRGQLLALLAAAHDRRTALDWSGRPWAVNLAGPPG